MVDYSKWDKLNFSSDEDDCHPNIEINTWRRLKERYRQEHGLKKNEPHLVDKWSSTVVNNKEYDLMNFASSNEKKNDGDTNSNTNENNNNNNNNNNNDNNDNKINEKPNIDEKNKSNNANQQTQPTPTQSSATIPSTKTSTTKQTIENKPKTTSTTKKKDDDDDHFYARSDPSTFLKEHMKEMQHFANIKSHQKADEYILENYELVHEATEGYLITHAVNRAVEGCDDKEKECLAYRCLQIHNLVQSCSSANVGPQKGVELFYNRMSSPQIKEQYKIELKKQVNELLGRIEARRKERLTEMVNDENVEDEDEEEKAPLGPGGLDPTEVLNSLPQTMKDAFLSREISELQKALASMPYEEAQYHFKRCIDAGLWVTNANDDGDAEADVEANADDVNANDDDANEDADEDDNENDNNNQSNTNTTTNDINLNKNAE